MPTFKRVTCVLDNLRWLWYLLLIGAVSQLSVWGVDSRPPIQILSYEISTAYPGGYTEIRTQVIRDLTRNCSLTTNRYLVDSRGYRFDLPEGYTSTRNISGLEKRAKGQDLLVISIPMGVATGEAILYTTLVYICNPVHRWMGGIVVDFDRRLLITPTPDP